MFVRLEWGESCSVGRRKNVLESVFFRKDVADGDIVLGECYLKQVAIGKCFL